MKRVFALVLAMAMMLCAGCAMAEDVTYFAWDEETETLTEMPAKSCTVVENPDDAVTWNGNQNGSWYVVSESVTIEGRITVSGNVHLILKDGAKLTAENGIEVSTGNSLTIYGQSEGSGTLIANGTTYYAGIGGGDGGSGGTITIHGGTVEAEGNKSAGIGGGRGGSGRTITIYGGTVTATSGYYGAGIGGSGSDSGGNGSDSGGNGGDGGTITIYGGEVTAKGYGGAGIGGGKGTSSLSGDGGSGGTITIYGGTVTANGDNNGAGIGGGDGGSGGTITIYGGTVTAKGSGGAGIGGGNGGSGGTIAIHGGEITAGSGSSSGPNTGGAGVGYGYGGFGGEITIHGSAERVLAAQGSNSTKSKAEQVDDWQQIGIYAKETDVTGAVSGFCWFHLMAGALPDEPAAMPETGSLPQTGDSSMLMGWVALLGASAMGLKRRR